MSLPLCRFYHNAHAGMLSTAGFILLWTITAVQTTDKTWKVTYLYDEKDFAEAGTSYKEVGMLTMIGIF